MQTFLIDQTDSDSLIVFPSPVYATNDPSSELGLRFHYNPASTYDRGSAKKQNREQASEVAEAIMKHITDRPHETLLAVAFSKHQQDAIEDELELRQRADPGIFSSFNQMHPFEPLRVKNLETVQGDERDVVLISVGYGRDAQGNLSMNFGPVNQEGGGRRLNVLMSRARKRCEVFTSIRAGDIRTDGTKPGLHALKTFLEFAETGILDLPNPTGAEPESILEEEIKAAIEGYGYHVDPQVGTVGFRIDLAVRHPEKPGRYVIGIECDGASYHSARSARDRDKLREMVLVARGWRLHRIWSTDWWRDREGCLQRCLVAIKSAIEYADSEDHLAAAIPSSTVAPGSSLDVWDESIGSFDLTGEEYRVWDRPFQLQGHNLADIPPHIMAKCIATVVAYEGPIHRELVLRRVRTSASLSRAGHRIAAAVDEGIRVAVKEQQVIERGQFLYWPQAGQITPRNRGNLAPGDRLLEFVPPEELDEAIFAVLRAAVAADCNEICEGVKAVLGFGRAPAQLTSRVAESTGRLQAERRLAFDGRYRIAET